MMNFNLPNDVLWILNTLTEKGYPAYVVGGCLRDTLRGKAPADWDIATAALPDEVEAFFPKTVPTGIAHGTVTILTPNGQYEVTTFRVDGVYTNHRKPESVSFTRDIDADLSRRDFTMNAMAYHPETGLVDPFGGKRDIKKGLIRCVGDPQVRFFEDALRMLRALRFAAQTGFAVHEDILTAIKKQAALITNISSERIRDELVKLLLSDRPENIELLRKTGLLRLILPELDRCFETEQNTKYHLYNVGVHTLKALKNTPPDLVIRLAALLHDIGKPVKKTTDEAGVDHFKGHDLASCDLAEDILTRLKFDHKTKHNVLTLVRYHDVQIVDKMAAVKRAVNKVGADLFLPLLALKRADALGQNPVYGLPRLTHYETLAELYQEIVTSGEALMLSDLAINGHDLMALGYQGKKIGELLADTLNFVLEHPEQNEKSVLLARIKDKK